MLPMLVRKPPRKLSLSPCRTHRLSNGQPLLRGSSSKQRSQEREPPCCGSVPVYVLLHSPCVSHFHRSNCQVSFSLSHSASVRALQESLWMRFGRDRKEYCSSSGGRYETKAVTINGNRRALTASGVDPMKVNSIYKVVVELFELDWHMESVLDQKVIPLSSDFVVAVLEMFKDMHRPALRFFRWASEKPGFSHDSRTYNALMIILRTSRQFEAMASVLEEMQEKRLLTTDTCNIAIRAFAKDKKRVASVFKLMKKLKFEVSIETYNSLIYILCRAKLVKEALVYFSKLKKIYPPNLKTYIVLLRGWCEVGDLTEAGRLWNEMTDLGLLPNVVAYNVMLQGMLGVDKSFEAIKLFTIMKSKGPTPDVMTYKIMISYFFKARTKKEAMEYFYDMMVSGIKPDLEGYTCLIKAFGGTTKIDEVCKILNNIKSEGLPLNERLYNSLIRLMASQRLPSSRATMYKLMVQNGAEPTVHTYNTLMKACFAAGAFKLGQAAWDEMVWEGCCCPDEDSYAIFVSELVRLGRVVPAFKYLDEMSKKGMEVLTLDYAKLAKDLSVAKRLDLLNKMEWKMRSAGKFAASGVFAKEAEMLTRRQNWKRVQGTCL